MDLSAIVWLAKTTGTFALVSTIDHIDYTISRYRSRIHREYDIVAGIYRTISCTNARLARALLTYRSGGVCLIDVAYRAHRPWLPLPHVPWGRHIMQWGLGDGSRTSGRLNYACRKADCARHTVKCQSRNDINTATPVQCPLTLTPACCCVRML